MARRLAPPLALVALLGLLHAGFYAIVLPPWAIEDEAQHVAYAWSIAHDLHLPTIEDRIAEPVVESIWDTDRWGRYRLDPPAEATADSMGMGGRSYLAYHPPGAYLAVAPLVVAAGDDATTTMYVLRAVTVVVAAAVCVFAGLLAAQLGPVGRRRHAALLAGAGTALLPSVAESGGRFNTDVVAALVVLVGILLLRRWVDGPSAGWSLLVGAVLAVAVLTRETTLVLAVPVVVAVVVVGRRGLLTRAAVLRCLAPPVAALALVLGGSWYASGRPIGSEGFLDTFGSPATAPGLGEGLWRVAQRALLPFSYEGWSLVAVLLSGLAVVLVARGLALAWAAGSRVEVGVALGMLLLQVLLLAEAVVVGLAHVTGRLLLPTYPVLVAVAVSGWVRRPQALARWSVPVAVGALAVWFAAVDLVPSYGWPWA